MGKQPGWIPRAVFAVMLTGTVASATLLLSIWLYRRTVVIAPDWMTVPHVRLSDGYLGGLWLMGTIFALILVINVVGSTLWRWLRVPIEALDGGGRSSSFPFNRRPPTRRAKTQPGSEGYVDHKIGLLAGLSYALRGVTRVKRDGSGSN